MRVDRPTRLPRTFDGRAPAGAIVGVTVTCRSDGDAVLFASDELVLRDDLVARHPAKLAEPDPGPRAALGAASYVLWHDSDSFHVGEFPD